jgi:4-hydroxy-2-oxoheptanedioate aldolase
MRTNHVKARLRAGEPAYGLWMSLPGVPQARLLARVGFDWIAIDAEHSHTDLSTLAATIAAIADAGTCAPLVRLPANSVEWFKWALDAGAWGVIVPMVNSPAEAAQAVRWCRYPPDGIRSIGGAFAPLGFAAANWPEYYAAANAEILVAVQIESAPALDHLDAIIGTPGVDVAFVGPNDLHAQIGLPPSSEGAEPEFRAVLDQVITAARRHQRALGIFCSNGSAARARVAEGFQMVNVATDAAVLVAASANELVQARNA